MAMKGIKRVVTTEYDGFILVSRYETKEIQAYEGFSLCPKEVREYITMKGINEELPCTHFEATAYGYI